MREVLEVREVAAICKGVQEKYQQNVSKSVQTPNSQLIPGLFSPLRRVLKLFRTRPFSLHKKHVEITHLLLRTFQDQGGCTWQNQGGLSPLPATGANEGL